MTSIKKRGITITFILYFALIVVAPIVTMNIISLSVYQNIIINNTRELVFQEQQNIAGTLEKEIKTYNLMLAAIVYNTDSILLDQATAMHRAKDVTEKFNLTERMDQRIELLMHAGENIDGLYFIFNDESYYYYNNPLIREISFIRQLGVYQDAINDVNKTQKGDMTTGITADSDGRYTLIFAVHPEVGVFRNDVEAVLLSAFTDVVTANTTKVTNDKLGKMLIVNEANTIMYSYDPSHEGQKLYEMTYLWNAVENGETFYEDQSDGNIYMFDTYDMKSVNWRIINLVDKREITGQAYQVVLISLYVIAGTILFFLLFIMSFFRGLIHPINELMIGMKHLENENLAYRVEASGNREMRRLVSSFNSMAGRIEDLVHTNKRKEAEKMQAEIDALQSQINPHFIVNVITSIRFMALMSKNEAIKNMSEKLIQILNTSFRKSSRFNTLEDELKLVESYIYIMQIRYGSSFDVVYEIDEGLLTLQLLKLILQPIVENSITHGLSQKDNHGTLTIRAYKQMSELCIEIIDDGIGIELKTSQGLLEKDGCDHNGLKHIGLANVHSRIVLHHGPPYGLRIISEVGVFTKVVYKLPILGEGGEQDD